VLEPDVLVLACVHLFDDLAPEHAGLHHVALLHRGDLVAPPAGKLEADPRDALDLVGVVDLRVDGALLPVAEVGDGLRLAEIDAAGQFAQDDDVEPLHDLALEARGVGERRIRDRGADIGEQSEVLAQPQQASLRAHIVGYVVPFRPAAGAEDDRIGGVRLRHRLVGNGDLVRVVAAAADQRLLDVELGDPGAGKEGEEPFHLRHHFRSDAVAGEEKEFFCAGHEMTASRLSRAAQC
jgi:hypothetical protein